MHRWARRFSREPPQDSTVSLIIDGLRLYAQAMDERFDHACFLDLWQLAETITLSDRGGTDEVCRRLAWHGSELGLPGSGFKNLLDNFARIRNQIVHRGIRDVDDEEVNFMKRISEVALLWLIRESKNVPTKQHLNAFYQLRTRGDTVVEAFSHAANFIAKSRKGSQESRTT